MKEHAYNMQVESKGRVGLVEDDVNIQNSTRIYLSSQGFDVDVYSSAEKFLRDCADLGAYDLLLIDLNLGGQTGLQLCEELKKNAKAPPIIIITARNDERTAVKCFELGADDFVRKPFGLAELKSRVLRVIGVNRTIENRVHTKGFTLDPKSRKLIGQDKEIQLTRTEYLIMQFLLNQPGVKLSRESLAKKISLTIEATDRTIDVHISRIRAKIKDSGLDGLSIESIYREGYILEISSEK